MLDTIDTLHAINALGAGLARAGDEELRERARALRRQARAGVPLDGLLPEGFTLVRRRIDDQLRGRAGRQGDPGASHASFGLWAMLLRWWILIPWALVLRWQRWRRKETRSEGVPEI
jgi:preprotein translocase subunit SecA